MVRKTDIGFLEQHMLSLNMKLISRTPGQFTEAYTNAPTRSLKRIIYAINLFYLRNNFSPKLAMGNILYFQKMSQSSK